MSQRRRISDVAIGLIIFAWLIFAFTSFIVGGDESANVDSGLIKQNLQSMDSQAASVKALASDISTKSDDVDSFTADTTQELETRGSGAIGLYNLASKNVIVGFIKSIGDANIPGSPLVLGLLIALVAVIITTLLLRAFWGENKL